MKIRAAVVAVVASMAMVGCSSNTAAPEQPAPKPQAAEKKEAKAPKMVTGPGTFYVENAGAVVTLDVPVKATDPRVADIEAYRQKVDAPELQYIVVEVDNTQGQQEVWTNQAEVVTADNRQVTVYAYGEVEGVTEQPQWTGDYDQQGVDLVNDNSGLVVKPGAVDTAVFATYEDISDPMNVFAPTEDYGTSYPATRAGKDGVPSPKPVAQPAANADVQRLGDTLGCDMLGEPVQGAESEYMCGDLIIVDVSTANGVDPYDLSVEWGEFFETSLVLEPSIVIFGDQADVDEAWTALQMHH